MKWATRAGCHIDRVGCASLIRRFIDPDAEFTFVNDPDEIAEDATAFDIRGVPLSHHEGRCTFETIILRYSLVDPALEYIARIVHEADLADDVYDAVKENQPGCPIIVITGYPDSAMLDRILAKGPITVLKKPLKVEQLKETVRILGHKEAVKLAA